MKAMKRPIPAGIASFTPLGIASTIFSRTPTRVRVRNRIPDIKMINNPLARVKPLVPFTTENAK